MMRVYIEVNSYLDKIIEMDQSLDNAEAYIFPGIDPSS